MELILVHPEIPHNTGCAGRLAAALGLPLHLVRPLGFELSDRYLKRAGLDYWPLIDLVVHEDWEACAAHLEGLSEQPLAERLRLFSARGGSSVLATPFGRDDVLVFGSESSGLPPALLEEHADRRCYIPIRRGVRSLNLANAIAVAVYTAMDRAGLALPDNDGTYEAHPDADADVWPVDRARPGSKP